MASERSDHDRIVVLEHQMAEYADWRRRIKETIPLAVFMAIVVALLLSHWQLYREIGVVQGTVGQLDQRMTGLDQRMARVEERLDQIDQRLNARMDGLSEQMAEIMRTLGRIEERTRQPQ